MTRLQTATCLGLLVALAAPDAARAFPASGTYRTLPGSATSQGPFNATGVLVVDAIHAAATFRLGAITYAGTFTDPTTLRITGCGVFNLPPAQSENVDWTFHFDAGASFAWTGSSRYFSGPSCSGALTSIINYTSVSMALVQPAPNSGAFESVPGSSTSQGPFSTIGVLTVDDFNATATFQIGSMIYSGQFTSDTTLEFNACVALTPAPPLLRSEMVHWTFEFDTYYSFAWTGTSSYYLQPSCITLQSVVQYTDVRMMLSGTIGVREATWGQVKSLYR